MPQPLAELPTDRRDQRNGTDASSYVGRRAAKRREIEERVSRITPSESSVALAAAFSSFSEHSLIHAFSYRGAGYILDPVTGVSFSSQGYQLALAEALAAGVSELALASVIELTGPALAALLLSDLSKLANSGLFQRSALGLDLVVEQMTRSYLAHQPRKMMLLVAQTCNLRCVYCYAIEGNFHDEGKLMSRGTAEGCIKFLARRSGRRKHLTCTLFGGEPLINYRMIRELVPWSRDYLRSIGKEIHYCITTNGTMLDDDVIEFLIREQFSIMISLDGPSDVHDASRPMASGKGSFAAAEPKLRRLLERHPHRDSISVRATMTHQHHDSRRIRAYFEELGFRDILLGGSKGYSFYKGPFDLTPADFDQLYESVERDIDDFALQDIRMHRRGRYNPVGGSLEALHAERERLGARTKISCGAGRNDQGVDVDGKVYPCHRYVGMQAYHIGDVVSGVDKRKVEAYYRLIMDEYSACQGCWATRWCGGLCPQYLSDPTGRAIGPDEPACDNIRRNLERNLALYEMLCAEGVDWESRSPECRE